MTNEQALILLCVGVVAFAAFETWRVTRPFERARREAHERRKAQGHAAE